jgi:hypothetical protein
MLYPCDIKIQKIAIKLNITLLNKFILFIYELKYPKKNALRKKGHECNIQKIQVQKINHIISSLEYTVKLK